MMDIVNKLAKPASKTELEEAASYNILYIYNITTIYSHWITQITFIFDRCYVSHINYEQIYAKKKLKQMCFRVHHIKWSSKKYTVYYIL